METVYTDYAPKGVKFYYLYKALAHPELNGYVKPFTLEERLMHVKEAQRQLGSKITWICDAMDNAAKHALGDRPNSEFIIDPSGTIVQARMWSDPSALRADLERLVGSVEKVTQIGDLDLPKLKPPAPAASGVVPRVTVSEQLQAVRVVPQLSETPFYVKLRAEVSREVLNSGSGTMYLGFHLDPIYGVHWNNLADPLQFAVKVSGGATITPASGEGPKVEVESDVDPREFLVDVSGVMVGQSLELTVQYFGCNDAEGWCVPVTQNYTVYLERDRDGGGTMGRSFGGGRGGPGGTRSGRVGNNRSPGEVAEMMLMEGDWDGDGKLTKDEAPEQLRGRFSQADQNQDGFVNKAEIVALVGQQNQGGNRGNRQQILSQLMNQDRNGDKKISLEEAPDPVRQRFEQMDANKDGFIDQSEIEKMMQR
ncbi:MAG: hypothetical protein ACI8V2_001285 [Candidatus Latescibacterota bacterium]